MQRTALYLLTGMCLMLASCNKSSSQVTDDDTPRMVKTFRADYGTPDEAAKAATRWANEKQLKIVQIDTCVSSGYFHLTIRCEPLLSTKEKAD